MDASSVRSGGSEGIVAGRKVSATKYKQNYDDSAPTSNQQAPSSPSHKSLASQTSLFHNNNINDDNVSHVTTRKEVKSLYGVSGEVKQSNKVKISRGRKPRIGQKKQQQSHTTTSTTNADNDIAAEKTSNVISQPTSTNQQQQQPISSIIEQEPANNMTYYTTKPSSTLFSKLFFNNLSITQQLREIRHTPCIMTPLSLLILLTILLSSFITLLFTFPQLILGIILGPTILNKSNWLVEFLYKLDICRWGHVQLMNIAKKSKGKSTANRSGDTKKLTGHSSTINQRITVVPNRVYVHPIPNFMDNIVYLIVCLPPPSDTSTSSTRISVQNSNNKKSLPIIGILVDCGESSIILEHMEYIYTKYYAKEYPTNHKFGIHLHSILCTHRHHDHTAGIGSLLSELKNTIRAEEEIGFKVTAGCASNNNNSKQTLDVYQQVSNNITIVGGAVEHVPHCNLFVKNNCFVPLPCISIIQEDGNTTPQEMKNDMNDVVSIEVIGVPSHTRGSVVYALRNRIAPDIIIPLTAMDTATSISSSPLQSHLFTGDTIFIGGGGMPFEADLELVNDNFIKNPKSLKKKYGSSNFRPGAGILSMERCFVEVLTRATSDTWLSSKSSTTTALGVVPPQAPLSTQLMDTSTSNQLPSQTLLYPGHEYTTDLLMRQFDQKTISSEIHWNRTSPSTFFTIASQYLISAHKRGLPPEQKLLTVPTPLEREIIVNPNYRMLKRRGELVISAIRLWYEFGCKNLIPPDVDNDDNVVNGTNDNIESMKKEQTQSVFTTVYSSDLQSIINDLRQGNVTPNSAADKIESLPNRLDEKLIGRRAIPSTLPSHKNVYLSVVALTMLGSSPSAVTISDANVMNMTKPVEYTDRILISKGRVRDVVHSLSVLFLLSTHLCPLSHILHHHHLSQAHCRPERTRFTSK